MRISTKGRYGLKAVMELSKQYGAGPLSVRELSESAAVPTAYLEQLCKKLRDADVITAARGAQGGYSLSKKPGEITVGTVLRTLEGSVAPIVCAEEGFVCANSEACIESYLYRRIREGIDEVIDNMTLQDMLDEQAKRETNKINIVNGVPQEEIKCLTK
jgi:Rrf2 family transcriptional regulator, cysteine metabolism repressor